jgi:hypothetical protein
MKTKCDVVVDDELNEIEIYAKFRMHSMNLGIQTQLSIGQTKRFYLLCEYFPFKKSTFSLTDQQRKHSDDTCYGESYTAKNTWYDITRMNETTIQVIPNME